MSFFKKIFSISSDDSGKRHLIRIFGLKIKVTKRQYEKLRQQHPYYSYVKNNVDITTVPPATGDYREFQFAGLAMLMDFDKICKQNNVTYWLDFGTLLGAVRHKGFIPWDDDIDLGMFRKDYQRLFEVVNNNTVNPDIYADYCPMGHFIKLGHKKCKDLFIDIFPVDEYGEIISREEQLEKSIAIKKRIRKYYKEGYKYLYDFEKKREEISRTRDDILNNPKPDDITKMQYVWGIDFPHSWKNWFTNYEEYFPFKTIAFEGIEFPCMNDPDTYLKKVYGNYMSYPKKMRLGHNIFNQRSEAEKQVIRDIINEKGLK